jgi:hypothetical protein
VTLTRFRVEAITVPITHSADEESLVLLLNEEMGNARSVDPTVQVSNHRLGYPKVQLSQNRVHVSSHQRANIEAEHPNRTRAKVR